MSAGAVKIVSRRQGRWGKSFVLEAQDSTLALAGVNHGDYLVVERCDTAPDKNGLVIVQDTKHDLQQPSSGKNVPLYVRQLDHYGPRVRLQPGSGPRQPAFLDPDAAGIWGKVVAVMRKFEAA